MSNLLQDTLIRFLQSTTATPPPQPPPPTYATEDTSRGRTVLTVLYLCVLGLCFVVPVFYYVRMHCDERQARRLRELEIAGIAQALEQSEHIHREESRAARRKYREERRARILQLFAPVRMVRTKVISTVKINTIEILTSDVVHLLHL